MNNETIKNKIPVVVSYSFDEQKDVFLFDNYKEAQKGLEKLYKQELRIQVEENEKIINKNLFSEISPDKNFAIIKTIFDGVEDTMKWNIGTLHVTNE